MLSCGHHDARSTGKVEAPAALGGAPDDWQTEYQGTDPAPEDQCFQDSQQNKDRQHATWRGRTRWHWRQDAGKAKRGQRRIERYECDFHANGHSVDSSTWILSPQPLCTVTWIPTTQSWQFQPASSTRPFSSVSAL
jgi:hypothetical protein